MPFREKFKESYKQAKDDFKSLLKLPGVTGDTRPNTPFGTRPHAGPLRPDKQVDNPTTSGFESPSSAQVSTSQLMTTPRNDAPKVQNELEQSPQPNRFVGQVHSDAANPEDVNCQVSGADVETDTGTAVVSEPQGIEPPDQGVVPATSHDQKEESLAIGGQPSVEVSRLGSDPESVKWRALKQFAAVLEPATNIFGPIKDVATLFLECVDKCEMAGEAQSEYEALRVRLEGIFEDLQVHFSEGHSLTMTPSMENLCKSIQDELNYIKLQEDRNLGGRYIAAPDDANKILACYRRIEGYIHRLSLNVNMAIYKVVHEQAADSRADRIFSRVDRLPSALPAWYDSAEGIELKRRGCTSGTRVDVLANILAWANSKTGGGVYWLNGMAGTGKTTIAYSVCAELSKGHQLAASFFCSRLREECRNVNNIIPSIAYQLAQFSQPFQCALSAVLEKDPNVHGRLPHMQFDALIARPILEVQHTLPECMVAVIDALDECEQKESTGRVLDVLLSKSVSLPVKFLVSSRPESEIRDQMTDDRAKSRLVLHELDKGEVQADIERYLREGLSPMNPSDLQITKLVEKAGILFIYAATAVRYIGFDSFQSDPHDRLRTILKGSPSPEDKESEEIDQLYMTVLEAALGNPRLRKVEQSNMRQVLHTVICARDSLTVPGLSDLLQINSTDRVRAALRPLWSVLHVVGSSELVTTLHASFPDFMFDPTRSKAYSCDSPSHNHTLSKHCLELIEETRPQFNICQLESSYISDEKVPNIEERVNQAISSGLLYACRYWADHLSAGVGGSSMAKPVRGFLSMRLLLWMEVLNLSKHMNAGMECTTRIVEWCNNIEDQELAELAIDAQRFVDAFASNPISRSTPHIYLSMLPFWPRFRPVSQCYASLIQGGAKVEGTGLDRRQLTHIATWSFDRAIDTMAVSPNGLWVALVIDRDVFVVDSSSGQIVPGPLQRQSGSIQSISFTPDGSRILAVRSSYESATIVGWDTQTGDTVLGPIQLDVHIDYLSCFVLSPDCTRAAMGSSDNTVRVWGAENGTALHCLEAQDWVMTVVFSPDGAWVAAACNTTLQAWNNKTGSTTLGPIDSDESIHKMAFSPDGSHLAHAGEHTIHIRNTQSGDIVHKLAHGHTQYIRCIEYSPDGRYLVSGSGDHTLRLWDTQNERIELDPLEGHTNTITSIAFMPDSSRFISADDGGRVCTWDVRLHSHSPSSFSTLSSRITSAKFTSDGTRFVTGSEDGAISIWNSQTGDVTLGPIQAHQGRITAIDILNDRVAFGSDHGTIWVYNDMIGEIVMGPVDVHPAQQVQAIAYSPDGRLIATGFSKGVDLWDAQNGSQVLHILAAGNDIKSVQFSPDSARIVAGHWERSGNVSVWDISNGDSLFGDLEGHTHYVSSVSYSPNGALIASGSFDTTIIIWDAYTGTKALGPLTGHSSAVRSVNFSPDSTRLVSGSNDRTIRIWDVRTGGTILSFQSGHEQGITSVAYSPEGNRILSCSYDMSVRIHDARSTSERKLSSSLTKDDEWTMNKDGWVVDDQSRLLVWVPADLRRALAWPRTKLVVPHGEVYLRFDKDRMGEPWAKCYVS